MPPGKVLESAQQQRVTVIVGGMHGSGGNMTRRFHRMEHRVIIVDRRTTADDSADVYWDQAIHADLTEQEEAKEAADQIAESVDVLDNLIFSVRFRGPEKETWDGEIALGMTAIRIFIERLQPLMTRGDASIVMVSSTAATHYTPGCSIAYHATKAAGDQMTRCYASELGPMGIRVNAVAPGYIVKDESVAYFESDPAKAARVAEMHPLKRYGTADDVAGVVGFLCSQEAAFVTGQIITVDGGLSLRNPGF
jgi:3-oxoacyl-[acyl-carrier protein] reductase